MSFPKILHRYFLLSLALALCLPLHAQTRRRTSRQPEPKVNVSELLQRYAFDEVIAAIDNGKADCTGAEANQIAATARLGADMLNATEKVTVLESRIVPLVDLLNHLPLRGSCAKWESMEQWKAKLNPLPVKLGRWCVLTTCETAFGLLQRTVQEKEWDFGLPSCAAKAGVAPSLCRGFKEVGRTETVPLSCRTA